MGGSINRGGGALRSSSESGDGDFVAHTTFDDLFLRFPPLDSTGGCSMRTK